MLLRVSIGWHFLTEGMAKVDPKDGKQFNSEGYFRVATGPLAPYFRGMIPDVNGLERLERDQEGLPIGLKADWAERARSITRTIMGSRTNRRQRLRQFWRRLRRRPICGFTFRRTSSGFAST